jgi:hypothetical protein
MIDLYAMGSPNVVKIYIALEEMALPYTVHPVDVFGEAQFKPDPAAQSERQGPRHHRSRGAGREAVHFIRIGGDSDLSGRKNGTISAQGHDRAI